MTINWYPGHMNKARKELAKVVKTSDAVIELRDARIPLSTANPLLDSLTTTLPRIIVLSKSDLANADITQQWQKAFSREETTRCLTSSLENPLTNVELLKSLAPLLNHENLSEGKKKQILITGIPNVGKSTLMNTLSGRKIAKTGNEPAVTQRQQRIRLDDNHYLVDTPGMLWPKLEDQDGAYKLAMIGSIRNTAVDSEDVGFFAAELLLNKFRETLVERYGINSSIETPESLLEWIGSQRGGISKQGRVDWHKTSEMLLNDYRSGKLGSLSLETPT